MIGPAKELFASNPKSPGAPGADVAPGLLGFLAFVAAAFRGGRLSPILSAKAKLSLLRIQPHHPIQPQPLPVILSASDKDARRTSTIPSSPNSTTSSKLSRNPFLYLLYLLTLLYFPSVSPAQNLDKPVTNIDEEVTAFAYAPNGNIVFSVRRMFKTKKYDLQRDDIWLLESGGKRKRLLEGQKFTRDEKLFTYQVESFTWSPNAHIIAVQLFTTTMDPDAGAREDAPALLLLDDSGRELRPSGKDPLILEAKNPLWLRDNQTLVYLTSADTPQGLYAMQYLNVSSGPAGKAFEGRTFEGASRISGSNAAVAVERSRTFDGPARLQRLDLLSQDDREVATLDAYSGGILVSPSGTRVAYFLDKEVLEIRDLTAPVRIARLRIGLGVLQWSADESRLYLKRTVEKKSADLVTFQVPDLRAYPAHAEIPVLQPEPRMLLHGLTIREYSLSPDGRFLGVVLPGKRNLQIFSF
jgi:hypothetical protein